MLYARATLLGSSGSFVTLPYSCPEFWKFCKTPIPFPESTNPTKHNLGNNRQNISRNSWSKRGGIGKDFAISETISLVSVVCRVFSKYITWYHIRLLRGARKGLDGSSEGGHVGLSNEIFTKDGAKGCSEGWQMVSKSRGGSGVVHAELA